MATRRRISLATAALVLALAPAARAQAPAVLPVQGYLTDLAGAPVEGERSITFALYTNEAGGTPLFSETQALLVEGGYFTAYVGDVEDLSLAFFRDNPNVWVGVTIGDDTEISPRMYVGSVPYAAYAEHSGDAETLGGLAPGDLAAATHVHGWGEITGVPADLADGDDDTTYAAGTGLRLTGTTFSVDTTVVQQRVTGACPAGQAIRSIDAAGGVSCEVDDGASYAAGTGLVLSGTTFSANTTYLQRRVSSSCPAGQAIRAIAADGGVTCEATGGGGAISTSGDTYTSHTLISGTSYVYVGSTFTPPSGTTACFVSIDVEIYTSAANSGSGPFIRIAYSQSGTDREDGDYGFYPGILSATARANMSRSSIIAVSSSSTYRFGCYYGGSSGDWVGDSTFCRATWMCW